MVLTHSDGFQSYHKETKTQILVASFSSLKKRNVEEIVSKQRDVSEGQAEC